MAQLKEDKKLENLLKVRGVNAQGYGILPKLLARDKRLSIESKQIYSYICTFAGSGTTAFPSVEIMIKELNISEQRFYKHRQDLIKLNYIEITREKNGTRFGRNLYELIQYPVPIQAKQEEQISESEETADKTFENWLKVKGVNAKGYGIYPKLVARDKRLSIESKGIYSYICAFAGSGTTAFPLVEIMIKELNISEQRFYKHRQDLIKLNYIEITREKENNRFGRNLYELIQFPKPLEEEQKDTFGESVALEAKASNKDENTKKEEGKRIFPTVNTERKFGERLPQSLEKIINNTEIVPELKEKVHDWVLYKQKRQDRYSEKSLKMLLEKIIKVSNKHASVEIIERIEESIANNYKGIVWDKLKSKLKILVQSDNYEEPIIDASSQQKISRICEIVKKYLYEKGDSEETIKQLSDNDLLDFYYLFGLHKKE